METLKALQQHWLKGRGGEEGNRKLPSDPLTELQMTQPVQEQTKKKKGTTACLRLGRRQQSGRWRFNGVAAMLQERLQRDSQGSYSPLLGSLRDLRVALLHRGKAEGTHGGRGIRLALHLGGACHRAVAAAAAAASCGF